MFRCCLALFIFILAISPAIAQETVSPEKENKKVKKQSTLVKQVCVPISDKTDNEKMISNLEDKINEWANANPGFEMESLNYVNRGNKECAIIIYEINEEVIDNNLDETYRENTDEL